jgi:hypothetical protein
MRSYKAYFDNLIGPNSHCSRRHRRSAALPASAAVLRIFSDPAVHFAHFSSLYFCSPLTFAEELVGIIM